MNVAGFDVGLERPFLLIAGPDTLESLELCVDVAGHVDAQFQRFERIRTGDQQERPLQSDVETGDVHDALARRAVDSASALARAARMKPVNSGWPSRGVDVNSGWN